METGAAVRDRRLYRGAQHFDADGDHDGVEAGRELRVPVSDQEAEPLPSVFQVGNGVAGHLGHPGTVRFGSHTEEVDDAGFDFNDEQHVVPTQQDAVDGEEVGSEHQLGLGMEELRPGKPGTSGGWG